MLNSDIIPSFSGTNRRELLHDYISYLFLNIYDGDTYYDVEERNSHIHEVTEKYYRQSGESPTNTELSRMAAYLDKEDSKRRKGAKMPEPREYPTLSERAYQTRLSKERSSTFSEGVDSQGINREPMTRHKRISEEMSTNKVKMHYFDSMVGNLNYSPVTDGGASLVEDRTKGEFILADGSLAFNGYAEIKHVRCGKVSKKHYTTIVTNEVRCPYCNHSVGEGLVQSAVSGLGKTFIAEYAVKVPEDEVTLWIDVYVPDIKLAIEYDGEQHFRAIEHWGGEDALKRTQYRDDLKDEWCKEYGVELLRIPYWRKDEIVEIVTGKVSALEENRLT